MCAPLSILQLRAIKEIFLCYGRIDDSSLYFSTNERRVIFAGDGKVVNFGGVWMLSQYSSHA